MSEVKRLVRLVCGAPGCGKSLGFIAQDRDGFIVENKERQASAPGQPRPVKHYPPFRIADPRKAPRTTGIAPLTCVHCDRAAVLRAGDAADALGQANRSGRTQTLKIIPHQGPSPRPLARVDWTD